MNKLKFNDFLKRKTKTNLLTVQIFFNLQNPPPPHFPLRGKVDQLCKKRRVLCWSISIISLLI